MRRTILLFLIAVSVGLSSYFGLDSLTAHSAAAPAKRTQVAAKANKTTVTNKVVTTPTPTPKATPSPTPVVTAPTIVGNSLSIPSIGLNASLVDVGLTAENAVDVPSGATQAGRWTGGGWPGAQGSVVFVSGHSTGVFSKLANIAVGQIVTVKYGDQTFNYKVVYKETVPLKGIDMSKPLAVYGGGSEGLNMMTCAGVYDRATGTYSQRLTVYTVRV